MKHVVSIVFTSTKNNFETVVEYQGKKVRVSQFGADFDADLMAKLLHDFDGKCDVICVSGFHPPVTIGRKQHYHPDSQRFMSIPQITPVVNGFVFRNTYVPWAIRNHVKEFGKGVFENQKIAFVSGMVQQYLANALSEYTDRLLFADPYFHFNVPYTLRGIDELNAYAKRMIGVLKRKKMGSALRRIDFDPVLKSRRFKEFRDADIVASTATILERCEVSWLKGKTLMLDVLPARLERDLRRIGIRNIIHFMPDLDLTRQEPRLNYASIEAILQCFKSDDERVDQDDILELITDKKLKPQLCSMSDSEVLSKRKFAFIVHPLSVRDLFRHRLLRPIHRLMKPLEGVVEKGLSQFGGIRYGKISGIRSSTSGASTEGIIYTLFDTPRQLLKADPQDVYDKLVAITEQAAIDGADIIGLGAFTKIVGDAGVTVASRSPIHVTTGNSLSAASTLWAARVACDKMGFLTAFKKGQKIAGTAMVVGATGSIGAVSAKLLSKVASRLVLTGPRADKLLELKEEIGKFSPETEVLVATNANRHAGECDLIVVSTSALDGGVINLDKVKAGCVICDVSRPLSFTPEEAMKRPDVLIIESGELHLPGDVEITCDIGLDESVVYACLAETALLALEGRFESFTLSRNINYHKVNEIYDMAKRHGARLATIRGPLGIITDQEIELCREHALNAMEKH